MAATESGRAAGGAHAAIEASDRKLRRELSFTQLLFLSVGSIIGSGWLFAVLSANSTAGPAVVLSWVIGGVLILLVALTYAEVAGMLPRSGAVIRYPHLTHGGYLGFIRPAPTSAPSGASSRCSRLRSGSAPTATAGGWFAAGSGRSS